MSLYAYVDILNFYTPGVINQILGGRVFEFGLCQTFSSSALILMAIPIFMIMLSMLLPARANRIVNLVVASLYVPVSALNVMGESWLLFFSLGVALELILLAVILQRAWTWPHSAGLATQRNLVGQEAAVG